MRGIDCANSRTLKMLPWTWFREKIGLLKIDSQHEITPRNMILREKFQNFSIFASIHTSISLNQDQGSIFNLRECAQSIRRLEKPMNRRFSHKNPKMFDFRFNTPIPSLNQGQGSVFKVWKCVQSILCMKLPPKIWFWGRNFKIFASIHTSISLNQGQGSIFTLRECAQSIFRIKLRL